MSTSSNNAKKLAFLLITLLCIVVAALYTLFAARTANVAVGNLASAPIVQSPSVAPLDSPSVNPPAHSQHKPPRRPSVSPLVSPSNNPAPPSHEPGGQSRAIPHLVALNLRDPAELGKVTLSALDAVDESRTTINLRCEKIYFAADKGICLTREIHSFSARTVATLVDASFQPLPSVRTEGIPTRARISPDGRYAAFTVFVTGHSYADPQMSTATLLLDAATGASLGNLEEFKVLQDGKVIKSLDFNYWGVTFRQHSNFFYATLRTGGVNYLVHGDIKSKTVTVTYKGVECPSLSPDESRIAFKKMISRGNWRLTVLNLTTYEEIPLAETESVDDQAEWLDNDHVLYTRPDPAAPPPGMSIMVVSADGSGQAKVFAKGAASPAVVR
jgi:Tol biopolymer transport system component